MSPVLKYHEGSCVIFGGVDDDECINMCLSFFFPFISIFYVYFFLSICACLLMNDFYSKVGFIPMIFIPRLFLFQWFLFQGCFYSNDFYSNILHIKTGMKWLTFCTHHFHLFLIKIIVAVFLFEVHRSLLFRRAPSTLAQVKKKMTSHYLNQ